MVPSPAAVARHTPRAATSFPDGEGSADWPLHAGAALDTALDAKCWAHRWHLKKGPGSGAQAGGGGPSARGVLRAWPELPSPQESEQRDTAKCKFDNQTPCWGARTAPRL